MRESAPEFPLPDAEPRELEVWSDLWRLPQAAMWRRLGAVFEVAMYARLFVKGEQGTTSAAAEARQWSDRLGLNPAAMLRLRWRVQEDELEERRARSRRADDELDAVIAVVDGR